MNATRKSTIRIALVERQPIFLEALCMLLNGDEDISVVATAPSVDSEFINDISNTRPNVVIINMLGLRNTDSDILTSVAEIQSKPKLIVMAERLEASSVRTAFEAGVKGYFLKEQDSEKLFSCIKSVHKGGTFLSDRVSEVVLSGFAKPPRKQEHKLQSLTPREEEVLILVAEGFSNKISARKLGLSVKTIEKYRANAMRKLKLKNVAQVASYAVRNGLLQMDRLNS